MADPVLAYDSDDVPAIHWQVMERMEGPQLYRNIGQFTDEQDAIEYASVEFERTGRNTPYVVYRITREVVRRFMP